MANVIAEAAVRVRADTSGFHQEASAGVLGSLKKVAIAAGGLFAAKQIFGGIISDMEEFDKNARQTQAVLKSTGGAANVTAAHVKTLANAIEGYSSIDDQAVTASENLLLTFRNVRNETGKGNAVFDQATKAIANVSVGMKEDLQSATIQVGKALNDPIKGMTALQRIGITLSDHQKKLVTRFEKSGQTMKAQKIILGELNKEFGGSAKALGSSLQGRITLIKDSFQDWARNLGLQLMPVLLRFLEFVQKVGPIIQRDVVAAFARVVVVTTPVVKAIASVTETVVGFFQGSKQAREILGALVAGIAAGVIAWKAYQAALIVQGKITKAVIAIQKLLNITMLGIPVIAIAVAIGVLVAALIYLYRNNETARKIIKTAWADIQQVISVAVDAIHTAIVAGVAAITAVWQRFGPTILRILDAAWNVIKTSVGIAMKLIKDTIQLVLDIIHGHWGAVWHDLIRLAKDAINGVVSIVSSILRNFAPIIFDLAKKAGTAIFNGIWNEVKQIPGKIAGVWKDIKTGIASGWSAIVSTLEGWVNKLLSPVNFVLGKLGIDKIGFAPTGGGGSTTPHHGFASGGIVGPGRSGIYRPVPGGVLKMVEAGHPEAVVPLDPSKKGRALDIINEILNRLKVRPQAAMGGIFGGAPSFSLGGIARSIAGISVLDIVSNPVSVLKSLLPSIPDLGGIPGKIAEGLMQKLVDGVLAYVKGKSGDGLIGRALTEATRMTNLRRPYLWGGGHAGFSKNGPWDCSGAVSQLLHAIGAPISSPLTSGGFMSWGKAGMGAITVLTNPEHVYAMIANRAFGTSDYNPGGGFGGPLPYGVRPGFSARHFRQGGIIPGSGPQPAVVHGGEMILTNQDRQRFGGLSQLAQSVTRLVAKLDKDERGLTIKDVTFKTDAKSFDALRRDSLNRIALGVRR